jgi:hypothetical protein
MSRLNDPSRMRDAIHMVSSMSANIRILLLTLAITIFHNGKFPRNHKVLSSEFSI